MEEYFSKKISVYLEDKLNHKIADYDKFFADLKNEFNERGLAFCCNFILEKSSDVGLLNYTIRRINQNRYRENIKALVNFILRPDIDNILIDLKVLAIKTISNYKDSSAVSALMYCLNNKDSNYKIRFASAEALGKIGDKNAFDSLSNVVVDEDEKSAYMKESAVVALGMLGDTRALDVFDSIINTKQLFLDKFSYLKERIVEAMAKFDISKEDKALRILKKSLFDSSSRLRIVAIETLMNGEFDCAYDLIYERLRYDDDIEVKKNALVALYNLSDRKILDEVISSDFPQELKDYASDIIKEYEDNEE